jgi:hypothetical protein
MWISEAGTILRWFSGEVKVNKKILDYKTIVIEQIQLIIISGTDEPIDRRTISQILESNWTQPPSCSNSLIIEILRYVLYSAADGLIGQASQQTHRS